VRKTPAVTLTDIAATARQVFGTKRASKYRNRKTVVDGITFDSKKEAERYATLRIRERAGEIELLATQVRLPIRIDGVLVCTYVADFTYFDRATRTNVVEDVKGMKTAIYRLKKKLVKAVLGIEITEV
jgi:hypothetical protein